jgi:biopolymer transport protein ExbB/TolQ
MNVQPLIDFANNSIYPLQGLIAMYGLFCVILVFRRIRSKQFRSTLAADEFVSSVKADLQQGNFERVSELCDSPPYWSKAVPQLTLVAMTLADRDPATLRRLLADKFDRDVLADLEYRMSWVNTVIKSAPMLGLLGTVLGMISAFGKIATLQKSGTNPSLLANDISFALVTTAVGLMIAIPLVLLSALIHVRLGRLQDGVQFSLGEILDEFDAARKKRKARSA